MTPEPEPETAERIARLRDRADTATPESWVPEQPGEEIAGELVRYEEGQTAYGRQVIAVIRPPGGEERSIWLLHAVLRGEFAKLRPRPGELLLIRYLGKKQGGDGTSYASYRLEIDRDDAAPDWGAIDEDAAASAPAAHAPLAGPAPSAPRPSATSQGGGGSAEDDDIPF